MLIFLAWDGDHIGRQVGRASLADDVEGLRRISQAIDQGNSIWKSWVEQKGGSIVSLGGDEGRAEVPADYLDELPKIRQQYASAVGSPVSVGIGMKLSEADRALIGAKLQGGDKIVFFTDEVNEQVEKAKEKGEKTEEEKIADEYLNKTAPAMNQGAFSGASRPSGATTDKPAGPAGETSENTELANLINSDDRPPAPESTHAASDFEDEMHGHAQYQEKSDHADDVEKVKGFEAVKQTMVQALQTIKAQAPVMDQLKQTAPDLYQAMVGLTQSVVGLAKQLPKTKPESMNKAEGPRVTAKKHPKRADDSDIYSYVKGIHTGAGSDLNKIPMDADFRLADVPLDRLPALRGPEVGHVQAYSKLKTPFPPIVIGRGGSIPDGHHRIAAARLRGDTSIRAYVPVEEMENYIPKQTQKKEFGPDEEDSLKETGRPSEGVLEHEPMGKAALPSNSVLERLRSPEAKAILAEHVPTEEGEDPGQVGGCLTWATAAKKALGGDGSIHTVVRPDSKGQREEVGHAVVKHGGMFHDSQNSYGSADDVLRKVNVKGAKLEQRLGSDDGLVLHHEAIPALLAHAQGDALDKGALPMPKATTRHHVVLPVGSVQDDKQKVMHSSGKQGWVQMGAGMIRSQDPAGHPVSSRNPSGT